VARAATTYLDRLGDVGRRGGGGGLLVVGVIAGAVEAVAVAPAVRPRLLGGGRDAAAVLQEAAHHAVEAHGVLRLGGRRGKPLRRRDPQELPVEQPLQHRPRRRRSARIGLMSGPHVESNRGSERRDG
jgi:hypothetical protein